jgi:transcriptional regulator with XRE-family HTH domain/tetratricopeptide (TPR) repeat protein
VNVIGSQDHPVAADSWQQREMRTALAARDISTVYRLLRRVGISQRQIAALTGQSQSEVSEILKGRQVMAYDVLARIADGLGVPRGYMGLAYDEATATTVVGPPDDEHAEEDESVKRRKFLANTAAVMFGAAVFGQDQGPWLPSPAQTPAPGRVGLSDVRQIEASTKALRGLDYQYGGGACRDAVMAQLSWAQRMLDASCVDPVRPRLFTAVADLHNLAGWTSFDIDLVDSARYHFLRALELAKTAENSSLLANVLYRMGRIYLEKDAPDDALKLFQLGQIAAQDSGSEIAVAILCANEAWAYAKMGSPEQTHKMIKRAQDEFMRADQGKTPGWAKFFTDTDVHAMTGTVYFALAEALGGGTTPDGARHARIAIPYLQQAIDGYGVDMARSQAFNTSVVAAAHIYDGDVNHGVRIGNQALKLAEEVKSTRVMSRLKPLGDAAMKHPNNSESRDLAERISRLHVA